MTDEEINKKIDELRHDVYSVAKCQNTITDLVLEAKEQNGIVYSKAWRSVVEKHLSYQKVFNILITIVLIISLILNFIL